MLCISLALCLLLLAKYTDDLRDPVHIIVSPLDVSWNTQCTRGFPRDDVLYKLMFYLNTSLLTYLFTMLKQLQCMYQSSRRRGRRVWRQWQHVLWHRSAAGALPRRIRRRWGSRAHHPALRADRTAGSVDLEERCLQPSPRRQFSTTSTDCYFLSPTIHWF